MCCVNRCHGKNLLIIQIPIHILFVIIHGMFWPNFMKISHICIPLLKVDTCETLTCKGSETTRAMPGYYLAL